MDLKVNKLVLNNLLPSVGARLTFQQCVEKGLELSYL